MIDTLADAARGRPVRGRPRRLRPARRASWPGRSAAGPAQLDRSRSRDLPGADELRDGLAATVPDLAAAGDRARRLPPRQPDRRPGQRDGARPSSTGRWPPSATRSPTSACCVTYWDVSAARPRAGNPIADRDRTRGRLPARRRPARTVRADLAASTCRRCHWYVALACYKLAVILRGHPLPLHARARPWARASTRSAPSCRRCIACGRTTLQFAGRVTPWTSASTNAPPNCTRSSPTSWPSTSTRPRRSSRSRSPAQSDPWARPPVIEELKQKARERRACGTSSCPTRGTAPA